MKILICWNHCNDAEQQHLTRFLRKILKLDSSYELDFVFDYDEFKEKKNKKEDAKEESFKDNYDSIIVLCELKWNNYSYSKLYGIELVQYDIRDKGINLPVLFLSFLSREQILQHDDSKQIISTYALGNHFIQLPMASEDEIRLFKAMGPIPSEEMEDNLNFVAFDKIVSTIRHDVNKDNIEACKKRLKNIIRKKGLRNVFEVKIDDCITVTDVRNICDEIEPEVKSKSSEMSSKNGDSNYRVLLLEDEKKAEILALINEAKSAGLIINHCRKTSEAYKLIEKDTDNEYSVLVVDFRIWDNPGLDFEYKRMTEKQGYRFIEDVVKLGRRYTFVSFSELPRAFRLRIASSSNTRVIPKEKNLSLSSEEQRRVLINDIIHLAEETRDSLAKNASDKEVFVQFYNTAASMKDWEKNKDFIDENSTKFIDLFINTFKTNKDLIFDPNNDFWNKFKLSAIEYKFNFQVTAHKPESEVIYDFFYTMCYKVGEIDKIIHNIEFYKTNIDIYENICDHIRNTLKINDDSFIIDDIVDLHYLSCEYTCERTIDNKEGFISDFLPKLSLEAKNRILAKSTKINYREPNYLEDISKFINQLIIRRLGLYIAYWIKENQDLLKHTKYTTMQSLNSFLFQGFIPNHPTAAERKKNSGRKTTNQDLWFSPRKDKGVTSVSEFYDIGMTIEEEIFFRTKYRDLYKKWNDR